MTKQFDVKLCKLIRAVEIAQDTFDFTVFYPELAQWASPGQFAHIYLPGRILRRPISICDIDKERGILRLVFQIRGAGTAQLAQYQEQSFLDILAPLGKGFTLTHSNKKALFVGGGIGVPPLLGAAKFYGKNATVAMGFRNRESAILLEDFEKTGARVLLATDDGSLGHHGLVTQLLEKENPDMIYACGPALMLRAVAQLAKEKAIPCEISLEERMACGVGACLGCAVRLYHADGTEYNGHVCKDGPVFPVERVVL